MLTRDLEYHLPPDLIATLPAEPRDSARLMVVRRAAGTIKHRHVRDLADPAAGLFQRGDLIVFNQSRVLPASFAAVRTGTGGQVTGLFVRCDLSDERLWEVMLESGGRLRPAEYLDLTGGSRLELIDRVEGGLWRARLHGDESTLQLLDRIGSVPLPPYIVAQRRKLAQAAISAGDMERYNTVYATEPGSVAAPTAGLHFTPAVLAGLTDQGVEQAYVTLHVGLGTFAPIRSERVEEHVMHSEWIHVPAATIQKLEATRASGGRIIPVGTTSVRALESLPLEMDAATRTEGFSGETRLLIVPEDAEDVANANNTIAAPPAVNPRVTSQFRFADGMMTNFHLPHSTLLALVAALPGVGIHNLKAWYQRAIEQRYRFYSYGDAMLLI